MFIFAELVIADMEGVARISNIGPNAASGRVCSIGVVNGEDDEDLMRIATLRTRHWSQSLPETAIAVFGKTQSWKSEDRPGA